MKLKILSLGLAGVFAATPALAAGPTCAAPDFAKQAKALVDERVKDGRFSGAVLVAKDGVPQLREGFGAANREWDIANTPDTKFRLGSITKQFTATAILQLVEAGQLSVDDPISKFYAEAPAAWAKVTIKHLLTHTSGIPSYTAIPGYFVNDAKLRQTPEAIIKLTRDKPLEFEPGSKFAYDNTGYILLGYVIEKVSGQPYADYVAHNIFRPLGMKNSGYDVASQILPKRAAGYQPGKDGWQNADYLDMSVPYAAGSLYSTVDDLLIWDRALANGKILTDASRKAMWTDYGNHYGFGWAIGEQSGHERIMHGGSVNGFSTAINRYSKDGLVVVVLSNFMASPSDTIAGNLAGLCLGTWQPPKAVAVPVAVLDRYVGSYQLTPMMVLRVFREGDHLVTQVTGQPAVPIIATGPNAFYAPGPDAKLVFKQAGDASATGVVLTQRERDREAPRIPDKP